MTEPNPAPPSGDAHPTPPPAETRAELAAELDALTSEAQTHAAAAVSPATKRAYRIDWADFTTWCDTHQLDPLPATGTTIALYLSAQARTLKVSTIERRLSSIATAHKLAGQPTPRTIPEVQLVMKGLRRTKSTAPTQKTPLRLAELRRLINHLDLDTPIGQRDHALLLTGFAGALRRSELTALNHQDLQPHENGYLITIRRSKTDQEAQGQTIAIPYGSNPHTCPTRTLNRWIQTANITTGPLWRPINRHGHIANTRLSAQTVSLIIKKHATNAGLDPHHYAAHSLRSGFATTAAENNIAERHIARQTRHQHLPTLRHYIHEATHFTNNPATQIGL